jgi:FAD/FMN-containing dehydrogenase
MATTQDPRLFCPWAQHESAVRAFAQALRTTPGKVRLAKPTSNLFRARGATGARLDASSFTRTLTVDKARGVAEVQGMCTFEDFVAACLAYGCLPAVVPELKTITVGGAVSGIGIEATSFRHGLVHETVEEIEVLCGDGCVRVCRADNEFADLFRAIPNSYGTLGYILRLRCKVVPARQAVRATYTRFNERAAFLAALEKSCALDNVDIIPDFVEGVCFDPAHYVLVTATYCDDTPDTTNTGHTPYYQNLQKRSFAILSTQNWIWRWDPDWFWCSRFYGMENPVLRRLFGRYMLRSNRYWKILDWYRRHRIEEYVHSLRRLLGKPVQRYEPVIQDVEIPFVNSSAFLDFYEQNIHIQPMWICPLRPLGDAARWTLYAMEPGTLHLNFGFWQSVATTAGQAPGHYNRLLEKEVARLGGRKSLYSHSFYPAEEFWRIYNGDAYKELKNRYDPAQRFPDLYNKTVLHRY